MERPYVISPSYDFQSLLTNVDSKRRYCNGSFIPGYAQEHSVKFVNTQELNIFQYTVLSAGIIPFPCSKRSFGVEYQNGLSRVRCTVLLLTRPEKNPTFLPLRRRGNKKSLSNFTLQSKNPPPEVRECEFV